MNSRNEGRISLHDTQIAIWEEPGKCDQKYEDLFRREVFEPIIRFLRSRRWKIDHDPSEIHYRSIAKSMRQGVHPDRLKIRMRQSGRTVELLFYQDVVSDHLYGGQYDFDKYFKMPYLIRLRFLAEARALITFLREAHGYSLDLAYREDVDLTKRIIRTAKYGRDPLPTEDPLGAFNHCWNFESDWKRGGRYKRDETGWPSENEYRWWNYYGVTNGSKRYLLMHDGYIRRGIAYRSMNGMCWFVYGPDPRGNFWQAMSGELFVPAPGQNLRKVKNYNGAVVLKKLLDAAVKAQDYRRTEILARALRKLLDKSGAGKAAA